MARQLRPSPIHIVFQGILQDGKKASVSGGGEEAQAGRREKGDGYVGWKGRKEKDGEGLEKWRIKGKVGGKGKGLEKSRIERETYEGMEKWNRGRERKREGEEGINKEEWKE